MEGEEKNNTLLKELKRKLKIPRKHLYIALIVEIAALTTIGIIFINYSRLAPQEPTQYANPKATDKVSCGDGKLKYNEVSVAVPDEETASYTVAYSWAEEDTEYPSVPRAAVASYKDISEELTEDSKSTNDKNDSEEEILYEISLYKVSYIPQSEIPEGKNTDNWFSDWEESESDGIVRMRVTEGNNKGFLISSIDAYNYSGDYRSYNFYFPVREKKGVSVFVVEGICYNYDSLEHFKKIMETVINSIKQNG